MLFSEVEREFIPSREYRQHAGHLAMPIRASGKGSEYYQDDG